MRVLIRFLSRPSADAIELRDRVFEGEALTLGRATDQVLHLKDRRVALRHARITLEGGRPVLRALAAADLTVNGRPRREARLRPGDRIDLGANRITVLEPADGHDLVVRFELDPQAARAGEAPPPRLDFDEAAGSLRRLSWLGFIAVLAAALLIPAAGLWSPGLQPVLRGHPLPDDGFWLSGPLATAHAITGPRCEACHAVPFVRVRNAACLDCHRDDVGRHAAADANLDAGLDAARCAACHAEHNEPATLLRRDAALCAACHGDLQRAAGASVRVRDASDFATDHPEFRASLLLPPAAGGAPARVLRLPLDRAGIAERSGLRFPHDQHLAAAGVDSPEGPRVLDCGDCHRPEPDGRGLQPVRMERDCAGCHRLDFDPAHPDARVPHGDPAQVHARLVEYYSRAYLEGYPDPLARAAAPRPVAKPGQPLSPRQRDWLLEQARTRATEVARDLFERRACANCHEVAAGGPAGAPWSVAPVRLAERYFPAAQFSHARHRTALSTCDDCHAARESSAATDLLIPGIANCRECHGGSAAGPAASGRVASDCVLCHAFHQPRHGAWPGGPG